MALSDELTRRLEKALCSRSAAAEIIDEINGLGAVGAGTFPSSAGAAQLGTANTDAITIKGLVAEDNANTGISAAGTTQGTATVLTGNYNRVTTVGANAGVKLPVNVKGRRHVITNAGANALNVYPDTGAAINGLGTNIARVLPVGQTLVVYCEATNVWAALLSTLPAAQFATGTTTTTFTAGQLTGAAFTAYTNTGATPGSIATRTATLMFGDIPECQIGLAYTLRVSNQGTSTMTITAGAGVTLTGTMTILPGAVRAFIVTFPSATTCTIQDITDTVPTIIGVAAGYKIARGVAAVTGTLTVVTGLTTVVAVMATATSDLDGDTLAGVSATIGDQAGAPAAGSVILKAWKVTTGGAAGNPTLIAANAAKNIGWLAIGV